MTTNLEKISADKVDLKKVRWYNYPNKVWEREYILLILHQKGETTKAQLIEEGFPQYIVERHLSHLIKKRKVQEDCNEGMTIYRRTNMRHKFHYEGATGELE